MVWSEYVNETVWEDTAIDDGDIDDGNDSFTTRLNCDEWTTYHSEDLLNMWFTLVEHRDWTPALWSGATYSNFCDFCYVYSYGEDEYTRTPIHSCQEYYDDELRGAWTDLKRHHGFLTYATFKDFCNYSRTYSK